MNKVTKKGGSMRQNIAQGAHLLHMLAIPHRSLSFQLIHHT